MPNIEGFVVALEDCKMSVWDGSGDEISIKKGEKLDITYTEYNGTLGLTRKGVEVCCSYEERKMFKEYWNYKMEQNNQLPSD